MNIKVDGKESHAPDTAPAVAAAARKAAAMKGYYQLIEGHQGNFMFALRAGNHETILESRVYWSRQAALDAVEAARACSQDPACFVRRENADGSHGFELHDRDGKLLARSVGCGTRSGLATGIASVQRNGPSPIFRGLIRRDLRPAPEAALVSGSPAD